MLILTQGFDLFDRFYWGSITPLKFPCQAWSCLWSFIYLDLEKNGKKGGIQACLWHDSKSMGSLLLARSCILVITTIRLSSEKDKAQSQARLCSSKALILIYGEAWSQSITVLPRHPLPLFSFLKILARFLLLHQASFPHFGSFCGFLA